MHETFVYCSTSQLLQVTFWHAYRDFFQHPSTVDQLLSASEVIKNVTIAFPGASAKVWYDEKGEQKFVIAGMGFRRGSGMFSLALMAQPAKMRSCRGGRSIYVYMEGL
jgi:chromatin structure-remodeling complex subunit RSC9